MSRRETSLHGVLVVDKPTGMTSHDVVQRLRRRAQTSRVGHAGTLDPMATGVLVVMVGEATKLGPYLTADDKRYRAELMLGRSTDTLDADGTVIAEAPLPAAWTDRRAEWLEKALAEERQRAWQIPPAYSAISIDGVRAHELARRGEAPDLAPRPVEVRSLSCIGTSDDGRVTVEVETSKGYYVRSLARDLGVTLGCPSHLTALRRLASGCFTLDDASPLERLLGETTLEERLVSLADAATRAMPTARLAPDAVTRARQGKRLLDGDFTTPPMDVRPTAWLGPDGSVVAVGARGDDGHRVLRGFV